MLTTAALTNQPLRGATAHLAGELQAGRVYRREDLARLSNAVDRHLTQLVSTGTLKKLAQGLYYVPKQSSFGPLPPADEEVVKGFLRDNEFLVFSPSSYNMAGLGTTQLYNSTLVYNHKRHGVFKLGNRQFHFRVKPRFPKKLTPEFLYVDLLNNLDELAEDRDAVLSQARAKLLSFKPPLLQKALNSYGNMATRKLLRVWIDG
jgi:hypothetical protein